MVTAPRMDNSRPESATSGFPLFNPIMSTPPAPTNPHREETTNGCKGIIKPNLHPNRTKIYTLTHLILQG